MMRFRNTALSPWRRPDGREVARGEVFEADEREAAAIIRRRQTVFLIPVYDDPASPAPGQTQSGGGSSDSPPVWTKRMPPDEYLEAWPNGPNAALARSVLEYRKQHPGRAA